MKTKLDKDTRQLIEWVKEYLEEVNKGKARKRETLNHIYNLETLLKIDSSFTEK
jgi:hypothetical protein